MISMLVSAVSYTHLDVYKRQVMEPKNVIVPLGTPIEKVIEFCGGYRGDPAKILMGGPMMGLALDLSLIHISS